MGETHTAAVSTVPAELAGQFFSLTPERVLDAIEHSGHRTTGSCWALNSLENRVFDVELDGGERIVGKFYRPGRWSRDTILDEHRLLAALCENEVPVVPPLCFPDGDTLHATPEGILFALFPRRGGRAPDELNLDEYREVGRLLARIHNVGAKLHLEHRPTISPSTYGTEALALLQRRASLPPALASRFVAAVERLVEVATARSHGVPQHAVHGDCHKGNLLRGRDGWFFLDFDDMGVGPAVQDFWLLLPGRRADSAVEIEALVCGYELFRAFDPSSLRLIEALRALRYVRYAAWIANRWDDPSFQRAFPEFGSERYWQNQLADLYDQLRVLEEEDAAYQQWS